METIVLEKPQKSVFCAGSVLQLSSGFLDSSHSCAVPVLRISSICDIYALNTPTPTFTQFDGKELGHTAFFQLS